MENEEFFSSKNVNDFDDVDLVTIQIGAQSYLDT